MVKGDTLRDSVSVLIIGPDSTLNDSYRKNFETSQLTKTIQCIQDFDEGYALVKKEIFDIVVIETDDSDILQKFLKMEVRKKPKFIIVSARRDQEHIEWAYELGAHGYILKMNYLPDLVKALEVTAEGSFYYSPDIASTLLNLIAENRKAPTDIDTLLTDQEKRILYMVCRQHGNREIARELHLSEYTIMRHKQNIKEKIGAKNLVGYLAYALRYNVVDLNDL